MLGKVNHFNTALVFLAAFNAEALTQPSLDEAANFYISYYSPADVITQTSYQRDVGANSTIIWDMSGDLDPIVDPSNSLIHALYQASPQGYHVAYWTDWGIYPANRALPYKAYFIPGAIDDTGNPISNPDFDDKAQFLSALVYSFLEIAPDGTLYFNDPWSDLLTTDSFCEKGQNKTCSYAYSSRGKPYSAHFGNFEAFSTYDHVQLDKYISVGGYGHDASFEQILGDDNKINTFLTSTVTLLRHYNLTGIDLDYENPNMSAQQSKQFGALIKALNNALDGTPYRIMVTCLANPAYLNGVKDSHRGFANNVLNQIAELPHVKSINLMTYDFYGAFNYNPDGNGRTGFLADTYLANNAPVGSINFSAQDSIEALISQGVPAAKIGAGIPSYGRALQGIDAHDGLVSPLTGTYSGLFASIPATAMIPRGDLDDQSCDQAISPLGPNSCSGSFTYSYIMQHFNTSAFVIVDWSNNAENQLNATTAYIAEYTPPVTKNYNLEVTNLSGIAGLQILGISNSSVNVGQLDWMNPNQDIIYNNTSNPNVAAIQDGNGLIVTWNSPYSGKHYQCPAFNFTSNTHIMMNPETGACDIKTL